jgi:hypothetical protein
MKCQNPKCLGHFTVEARHIGAPRKYCCHPCCLEAQELKRPPGAIRGAPPRRGLTAEQAECRRQNGLPT